MTHEQTVEGEQWEVGVSFRRSGKSYSFASKGLLLSVGDGVLVRTEKGVDLGQVMEIRSRLPEEEARELMPVVRVANEADLQHVREQEEKEKRALEVCAEKIAEHNLPMKLIDASLSFDNTRLVFSFGSEGRVDFRELVRDLAKTFRKRIELRQVGVRDEAKLLGGLGPCGRRLCCKTFLRSFEPVGIRIAKDQGLALNPSKISGLCDRLMCCLRFEQQMYQELRDKLPTRGDKVSTQHGDAQVKEVHVLKEELVVILEDGREARVPAAEVGPLQDNVGRASQPDKPGAGPEQADREAQSGQPQDRASESKRRGGRRRRSRSRRKPPQSGAETGPTGRQ
jgi:cell fate regulator YaaT (PSP1 superfamily)